MSSGELKYPKRSETHIQERISKETLTSVLPDKWIPREVTERDYGIDLLIEIVHEDESLRGEVVSIQLKSSRDALKWNGSGQITESGINTSTGSYWLSFAIPVFICLVDIASKEVYFANAKEQCRQKFPDLLSDRDSMSFHFEKANLLTKADAWQNFYPAYRREFNYEARIAKISDLLLHQESYFANLSENIGKDFHLSIEPNEEIQLFHIYTLVFDALKHLDEAPMPIPLKLYFAQNEMYCDHTGLDETYYFFAENLSIWLIAGLAYVLPRLGPSVLREEAYWLHRHGLFRSTAKLGVSRELSEWHSGHKSNQLVDLFRSNPNPPRTEFERACKEFHESESERVAGELRRWAELELNKDEI